MSPCSTQDIVSGLDAIMSARGDVLASIEWFFRLHSEGRDSLSKDEVLRLSESLLFRERQRVGLPLSAADVSRQSSATSRATATSAPCRSSSRSRSSMAAMPQPRRHREMTRRPATRPACCFPDGTPRRPLIPGNRERSEQTRMKAMGS